MLFIQISQNSCHQLPCWLVVVISVQQLHLLFTFVMSFLVSVLHAYDICGGLQQQYFPFWQKMVSCGSRNVFCFHVVFLTYLPRKSYWRWMKYWRQFQLFLPQLVRLLVPHHLDHHHHSHWTRSLHLPRPPFLLKFHLHQIVQVFILCSFVRLSFFHTTPSWSHYLFKITEILRNLWY